VTSDLRYKNSVRDLDSKLGLDFINSLRPVDYLRNNAEGLGREMGFIAQEVRDSIRNASATDEGFIQEDSNTYLALRYNDFFAPIVKAIQELSVKVDKLEKIFQDFITKRATINELCVGTVENRTCIDKSRLDSILQEGALTPYTSNNQGSNSNGSGSTGDNGTTTATNTNSTGTNGTSTTVTTNTNTDTSTTTETSTNDATGSGIGTPENPLVLPAPTPTETNTTETPVDTPAVTPADVPTDTSSSN
jgi:hypothetical protein